MNDFRFFDAHCRVGLHVRTTQPPFNPHTPDDLLADMDHFGVHEAMVLDCLSWEFSPKDGNPRIVDLVKDHPRLHPAWVGLPAGSDETPPADELVPLMRRHGVAMLFLLPRQYRFPLADWAVDDMLAPLAESRVPVCISYDEVGPNAGVTDQTDWNEVIALCRRFPTLPVIVGENRMRRSMRTVYRAMGACGNLHLELSGYWLHRGIEYLAGRFGAQRLIFGSNWPALGVGATLAPVSSADLNDADKRNIAGDNLRRLVAWCGVKHPKVNIPAPADELVAWGRTGVKPDAIEIYDNHGHLGGSGGHYHVPDGDTELMVRDMDRYGIRTVCVFSLQGVFSDERYGNDIIINAVNRFPDRFIGFALVNPHRGEQFMLDELQRCRQAGLRGIKLIPTYQAYPKEGPNIDVPCRFAHEHRQFILNHDWSSPQQMERLVATYTDACFFTGHTTTAYADIMKRYANLFVCTCPVHKPCDVERVVRTIGADRFLFGSDLTDLPIAWGLGPILFARISEREKRLIIGENLKRLMERYSRP